MGDLEALLRDARDKSAAEAAAADLRKSLSQQDAEIVEFATLKDTLTQRISKAGGLKGMLRRGRSDPQVDAIELARVEASLRVLESKRTADQAELRTLKEQAHGAELARASLGVEMRTRTAKLSPDDPARARLNEIDAQRETLVEHRHLATSVSTLAAELLLWVDGAERADDGTDELYVEFNSASRKREELQEFLQPNALLVRTKLKDRLESFRTLDGGLEHYPVIAEIQGLAIDDHVVDYEVWLHRVRVALESVLASGVHNDEESREQLKAVDSERLSILAA